MGGARGVDGVRDVAGARGKGPDLRLTPVMDGMW